MLISLSFPQNAISVMYISLQREDDCAGLERKTERGRHSADIRRVQKEIDDLRAIGRKGENRQRNTYQ